MLTDEQLAILRDIDNSVAFDDEEKVAPLVMEGYVEKDGDLFQLTSKGEKMLLDNGALDPGV
jgi:coproporphyrinogen III oxidase-like Fe-S oxidoreductase